VSADDDGYVHRPGAARKSGDESTDGETTVTEAADASGDDRQGVHPARADRDLGGRGWILVGVLAFSLLGAPLIILFRPPNLPYWVALLALPMLPAILLGAVGVWATTRP
jgi:hypothetical protein